MSFIDAQLYRNLKDGKEYERLIPVYKGTEHNFDKEADNSNTYDTLRYMSEWAYKYAYQMKDVAPLLKGRSLQETVNKIYTFLYSHFQYKLDGQTQNLYSPSAAWHFRRTGFDCKTYSILASTILQNLGIPHSFRMVQQAGIMPGEWSHVYVIVPNGNTHLVIDATTHTNKEVSFTQKHDYTMKHRGLASPYVGALGCACQGTPIRSNGLGSPSTLANTIKNFHNFLDVLEKQGIPKVVTNRMLVIVRANIENGIDPNMGEVLKKALATTSSLGYTFDPVSSITPAGSTYGGFSTSLPTTNYYTPTAQTAFGSALTDIKAAGTSALSNVSVQGINVGSLVTNLASGNFVGAGLEVLKAIIPIDKTFGAVFANGFNLSCWNSTLTPAQTKLWAEKDIPAIYAQTLDRGLSEASLNQFIDAMNWVKTQSDSWGSKMQSCSKEALKQYGEAAIKAKIEVLTKVKEVVKLTPIASVNTGARLPFTFSHANFNVYDKSYQSERFAISLLAPPPTAQPTAGNANPTANTDNTGAPPITAKKSSSSSTPLLLGAGLLALKLFL